MKRFLISLILAMSFLVPISLTTPPAYAACSNDSQGQVLSGFSNCSNDGQKDIRALIGSIISILSWIVGIAAVIVIILSALKYITSGGDSNKTGEAKKTLIYALVGLLVAALAQFIIHFTVTTAETGCPPGITTSDSNCKQ